ncbi:MAG: type VI secretion system tip protein VgrG [Segetibacter sp.]
MPLGLTDTAAAGTGEIVYELSLGGDVLPTANGLLSIVVERSVNRIASAQIILLDNDSSEEPYELSNQSYTKPGSEVEIKAGYEEEVETVFKGFIVSQRLKISNRKSILILECKDKTVKMTMVKKSAYYFEMKDSDVWNLLISGAGLEADVAASGITHKEMVQYSCTDWDFLISRAEVNGMFVITADGKVKVMKPVATGTPSITAKFGDNMFEFDADMDSRTQLKEIKASSWDPGTQDFEEGTSAEPLFASNGDVAGDELAKTIADETYLLKHSGKVESDELKAWADAKLIKSRMAKMRGRVRISGNALAIPGELIGLDGVGDRFNGTVMATAVRHEISGGNWFTDVQFGLTPKWYSEEADINEPSASAMLPAIQGLQIGIVTVLENDPDGECRIKVKVPVISNSEDGLWARLAAADAGNNRGWALRPEIGDEVIVGFINNDPRDAIVLGALHSSKYTTPIAADDANDQKGWVTRSGIKIVVDDKKKSIEISTIAGNKMIMDEDAKNNTTGSE